MQIERFSREQLVTFIEDNGHGAPVALSYIADKFPMITQAHLYGVLSAMVAEGTLTATRDERYFRAPIRITRRGDLADLMTTHTLTAQVDDTTVHLSRVDPIAGVVQVATVDIGLLLSWAGEPRAVAFDTRKPSV